MSTKTIFKAKADRVLFLEIKTILEEIRAFLPPIVQNDMDISGEDLVDFVDKSHKYINKLENWVQKVKKHINPRGAW